MQCFGCPRRTSCNFTRKTLHSATHASVQLRTAVECVIHRDPGGRRQGNITQTDWFVVMSPAPRDAPDITLAPRALQRHTRRLPCNLVQHLTRQHPRYGERKSFGLCGCSPPRDRRGFTARQYRTTAAFTLWLVVDYLPTSGTPRYAPVLCVLAGLMRFDEIETTKRTFDSQTDTPHTVTQ